MRSNPYYEEDSQKLQNLQGIPLRVIIYEDIKKYIIPGLAILLILYGLYIIYGWGEWYIYAAAIIGAISSRAIIPIIARKLMSYAAVVNFELKDTGAIDKLSIDLIPMPRFMDSIIIDEAGYPAALNAPLATRQGPAYIVESAIYKGEQIPGTDLTAAKDIFEVNPLHKNTEFLKKYKTAFLALRKDALEWLHELNALKLTQKIEIAKGYTYRTRVFSELADKVLFKIEDDPIMIEKLNTKIEELEEKLKNQGEEKDGSLITNQE